MRVLLRVLIVAAVVIALVAVETSTRSGVLWRLITFTYQANLLAAVYCADFTSVKKMSSLILLT